MIRSTLLILATSLFLASCDDFRDVPSLHEQMEGNWRIQSYTMERYNATLNTSIREEITARPSDYMQFIKPDRIVMHFDTAASTQNLSYNIIDARTLSIEGKSWTITKLDQSEFNLSSNQRDTSFKLRDLVGFHLVR